MLVAIVALLAVCAASAATLAVLGVLLYLRLRGVPLRAFALDMSQWLRAKKKRRPLGV